MSDTQNTMTTTSAQMSSQVEKDLDTIIKECVTDYIKNNDVKILPADRVRQELLSDINMMITCENSLREKNGKLPLVKTFTPYITARVLHATGLVKNIRIGNLIRPCVYVREGASRGIWKPVVTREDDSFFRQLARKYQPSLNNTGYEEVKSYVQDEMTTEILEVTTNPALVACRNGVVDVYTQKFIDWDTAFTEGLVFTSKLAVDYKDNPVNKVFHDDVNNRDITVEDILREISGGDDEHYQALLAAMHLMLRKNWSSDMAVLLVDPQMTGANGKSSICTLLQGIIGADNFTSIGLHEMSKDFVLTPLITCSAVINADADDSSYIEHSEYFKKIAGGDAITIKVKFKEPISGFRFPGHIFQCVNGYLKFKETSEAIDRRFYFIDCTTHFKTNKNRDIKDVFLKDEEVLEYVLKMLLDLGYKTMPEFKFQEDLKKDFRSETNPVDAFLDYITDPENIKGEEDMHWDGFYPTKWLFPAFCGYYYENYRRYTTMSSKAFFSSMRFWVEKHKDEWEIPMDSKGKFQRVSPGERMNRPELFTKEFCAPSAGNQTEMQEWMNPLFMSSSDDRKKYQPCRRETKYACLRRIAKTGGQQKGDA